MILNVKRSYYDALQTLALIKAGEETLAHLFIRPQKPGSKKPWDCIGRGDSSSRKLQIITFSGGYRNEK
jgi:hypothetical protein